MKALLTRAREALDHRMGRPWRWSHTVKDYYPVHPRPRWGHGRASNPHIAGALEKGREDIADALRCLSAHRSILATIPEAADAARPLAPYWDNNWFHSLDAAILTCLIAERKPPRYIEIGSGFSTKFTRHALRQANAKSHMTSIDPMPRAEIDQICDEIIRCGLEDCDVTRFDVLERGDLLFFDGSHRVFQNSDVAVFFLEVLPRLKPGVLVHIHDIFLPDDYPAGWSKRLYSEQYVLAAMLLCSEPPFKVVMPNYFVAKHEELSKLALDLFQMPEGALSQATLQRGGKLASGSSFWIETI